jgi:hypothetical protein
MRWLIVTLVVLTVVTSILWSRMVKLERRSNELVAQAVNIEEAEKVKCQAEKEKVSTQPAPMPQVQTSEEEVVEMVLPKTTIRYRIPKPDMLIEQQQETEEVVANPPTPPVVVVKSVPTQQIMVYPKIKVVQRPAPVAIYSGSPDNPKGEEGYD